jgi:hypothetical protein
MIGIEAQRRIGLDSARGPVAANDRPGLIVCSVC